MYKKEFDVEIDCCNLQSRCDSHHIQVVCHNGNTDVRGIYLTIRSVLRNNMNQFFFFFIVSVIEFQIFTMLQSRGGGGGGGGGKKYFLNTHPQIS